MSFIWTCGMCGRKIFINVDVTEPLHMSRYACALCEECFKKEKKEKKQELDIYFEEYIDEFGNESYRTPDSIVFSCVLLETKYFNLKEFKIVNEKEKY